MTFTPSAVVAALADAARSRPDSWAVRDPYGDAGYSKLLALVEEEAAALADAGLGPGDLVLLKASHDIRYLVAYFAVLHIGARVMPMDAAATQAEERRELSRYSVPFTFRGGDAPVAQRLVPVEGGPAPGPSLAGSPLGVEAGPRVLLPTSGTGGLPKRAVHLETRLLENAAAHSRSVGLTHADVSLIVLSPAFGYCHTAQILATVLAAGRLVFPPRPALPAELGDLVDRHGVTTTTLVPHQLGTAMLEALGRGGSLRQLVVGGSPLNADTAGRVRAALPTVELVQTWGMTEAGPRLTTWRSGRDSHRPGSVGLAVEGVRIEAVGPDGRMPFLAEDSTVRAEPAELIAYTPYLMDGYLDAAEQTAGVMPADGILRTGDLGSVDADGYVYVSGRLKNLIDVGGKKVAPEEIEAVLLECPGIAEARVLAEVVAQRGEQPVAQVVLDHGTDLSAAEITEYARAQLARHKWPRRVDVVDRIDRTANGKVLRW